MRTPYFFDGSEQLKRLKQKKHTEKIEMPIGKYICSLCDELVANRCKTNHASVAHNMTLEEYNQVILNSSTQNTSPRKSILIPSNNSPIEIHHEHTKNIQEKQDSIAKEIIIITEYLCPHCNGKLKPQKDTNKL